MILGIDVRSLADRAITGVGQYARHIISALNKHPDPRISEIKLLSFGKKATEHKSHFTDLQPSFTDASLSISSKLAALGWYFNTGPRLARHLPRLDYLWLPHMGFFDHRIKVPYTLTVHDLSFVRHPEFYSVKRNVWHSLVRFQKLAEGADRIIAVSEYTKHDLLDIFPQLQEKPIAVIHHGMECPVASEQDVRVFQKYGISDTFILHIGTMEPRKNLRAIIKAVKLLANKKHTIELVVAGGKGWRMDSFLNGLRKDENVKILGYVTEAEKAALYAQARAFVWPSFYEGFGLPVLEAAQAGIPIITSYHTVLPEVLENKAVYINPYNYGELARAIEHILAKPRAVVIENMNTWGDVARQTMDFIYEGWKEYENRN